MESEQNGCSFHDGGNVVSVIDSWSDAEIVTRKNITFVYAWL
jgi:hypothetical protein